MGTFTFDHPPSNSEVAKAFGFIDGAHYQRIIDASFTLEEMYATKKM